MAAPRVSVVVAHHNAGPWLLPCLRSIFAQTERSIEVLLADDASTDGGIQAAEAFARTEPRLRVLRHSAASGPAAARNRGFAAARGRWIAVVDADDLIVPDRLERLLALAEAEQADIVADDLLSFHMDAAAPPPQSLLRGRLAREGGWVTPRDYAASDDWFGGFRSLGYLKPIFRREALHRSGLAYDESLRIGEDLDFVLRLLLAGLRLRIAPTIGYLYRRHAASTSFRAPPGTTAALRRADAALRQTFQPLDPALVPLLDRRLRMLDHAGTVENAMLSLKSRQPMAAARALMARPAAARGFLHVLGGVLGRRLRRAPAPASRPAVALISRQRLEPAGNGSSAYLRVLCAALDAAGFAVEIISPTPAMFGRRPLLRLDAAAAGVERLSVRGAWRLGPWLLRPDPRAAAKAAAGIASRVAGRFGVRAPAAWDRPAAYAIAQGWTTAELIYIARRCQGRVDLVVGDYAFTAPALPFALPRTGATAIVMHDLLSARQAHFAATGAADSVATLDAATEMALLGQARLVLAIQEEEARVVRAAVGRQTQVVTAPMAVEAAAAPASGTGGGLLFVGGAAMPNLDGMRWFLRDCWPELRRLSPDARLRVAGRVCEGLAAEGPWPGVELLGRVDDLDTLMAAADVVISPLRLGSGLKIKLIEALAAGKAVVATSVTMEGAHAEGAAVVADDAAAFAQAAARLLGDTPARMALGARALDVARRHFAPGPALAPAIAALRAAMQPAAIPIAPELERQSA